VFSAVSLLLAVNLAKSAMLTGLTDGFCGCAATGCWAGVAVAAWPLLCRMLLVAGCCLLPLLLATLFGHQTDSVQRRLSNGIVGLAVIRHLEKLLCFFFWLALTSWLELFLHFPIFFCLTWTAWFFSFFLVDFACLE